MAVGRSFSPRQSACVVLALAALAGCGQTADPCSAEPPADSCPCPEPELRCDGLCVDVASDTGHCGSCESACGTAQVCLAGSCQCAVGANDCGDACAHLQSDDAHCGSCEIACDPSASCQAGICVCPNGSSSCSGSCANLDSDVGHCGACGNACALGEVCKEGNCFSDAADECGGRAHDVDIRQVALFQSIETVLADGGAILADKERVVDVIVGKSALVRVHVDVSSGFEPRELSARLSLRSGQDAPVVLFKRQTVSADSAQYLLSSSLNIEVPAELLQSDTRYHVELVECGGMSAPSAGTSRVPALGEAELGARTTGPIKVAFLPIRYNGLLPDTSGPTLQHYVDEVVKQYGTTGLETEVLLEMGPYSGAVDWDFMLDEVLARRAADAPDDDVYYYALLKPDPTFADYCPDGCTEGIAYIPEGDPDYRVGLGVAFADAESASTFAHELGHNHERDHAPCGAFDDDPDLNYPYPFQVDSTEGDTTYYSGAKIGQWGYDAQQGELKDPNNFADLMGYCTPTWISDYTFNGISDVIAGVHKAAYRSANVAESWDILRVTSRSSYWVASGKLQTRPSKATEIAVVYDRDGLELERVDVYRYRVSDGGGYRLLVPHQQPGWYAIGLVGGAAMPFP